MVTKHACIECGKEFVGGNAAKRCPVCRRPRYLPGEYKLGKEQWKTKNCICCGKTYWVPESGREYCSECAIVKVKTAWNKLESQLKQSEMPLEIRLPYDLRNPFMEMAAKYQERFSFILDWSLSLLWGNTWEIEEIPKERIIQLSNIWIAVNMPFEQIRQAAGLSQKEFSQRYCIPQSNIKSWEDGSKECKLPLKLLLEKEVGLLRTVDRRM